MADFSGEDALDQPISKWHDLRNAVHEAVVQIAVVAANQHSQATQGDRIEKTLAALHSRHDSLDARMASLERDHEVTRIDLNGKIKLLEERFATPRNLVYAMVALILVAFIGGLIALVFRR